MYRFIKKKLFRNHDKVYSVEIPENIDIEIIRTLKQLDLTDHEIKETIKSLRSRKDLNSSSR